MMYGELALLLLLSLLIKSAVFTTVLLLMYVLGVLSLSAGEGIPLLPIRTKHIISLFSLPFVFELIIIVYWLLWYRLEDINYSVVVWMSIGVCLLQCLWFFLYTYRFMRRMPIRLLPENMLREMRCFSQGVSFLIIVILLMNVAYKYYVFPRPDSAGIVYLFMRMIPLTESRFWAFFAFWIIVPLVEELYYRGVLLRYFIARVPFYYAAVAVSILSAMLYADVHYGFLVFLLSMLLCYFVRETKTLAVPVCFHILFNMVWSTGFFYGYIL